MQSGSNSSLVQRWGTTSDINPPFLVDLVSIRAPAWGATRFTRSCIIMAPFQSTHPRRVRRILAAAKGGRPRFQSTHPRRVRLGMIYAIRLQSEVSIHAPAKGATESGIRAETPQTVSIHAPARGATWSPSLHRRIRGFNPRTREGCDYVPYVASQRLPRFNPRTREGCDPTL